MYKKKQWIFYLITFLIISITVTIVLYTDGLSKLDTAHVDLSFLVDDEVIYVTAKDDTRVMIMESELFTLMESDMWISKTITPSMRKQPSIVISTQDKESSINLYASSTNIMVVNKGSETFYRASNTVYDNLLTYISKYDQVHELDDETWKRLAKQKWYTPNVDFIANLEFLEINGIRHHYLVVYDTPKRELILYESTMPVPFIHSNILQLRLPKWFKWGRVMKGQDELENYEFKAGDNLITAYNIQFVRQGYDYADEDINNTPIDADEARMNVFFNIKRNVEFTIYGNSLMESNVQRFFANFLEDKIIISEVHIDEEYNVGENSRLVFLVTEEVSLQDGVIGFSALNKPYVVEFEDNLLDVVSANTVEEYNMKAVTDSEDLDKIELDYSISQEIFDELYENLFKHKIRVFDYSVSVDNSIDTTEKIQTLMGSDYVDNSTIEGAIRFHYLLNYYDPFTLHIVSWHECYRIENEKTATLYIKLYINNYRDYGLDMDSKLAIINLTKTEGLWRVASVIPEYHQLVGDMDMDELFLDYDDILFDLEELGIDLNDIDGDGILNEYLNNYDRYRALRSLDIPIIHEQMELPYNELSNIYKHIQEDDYDFSFLYEEEHVKSD